MLARTYAQLAGIAPPEVGAAAAGIAADDQQPAGRAFIAMRYAGGDGDGIARRQV